MIEGVILWVPTPGGVLTFFKKMDPGFLLDALLSVNSFLELFPFGRVDAWLNNKSFELVQGELVGFGPCGGDGSA
ncbi:hypothetical protein CDAR_212161 [Caerostris darwini]|uniref:Uncharacterized protein n=1 Tax=Caerostris darwini TaxID=1538125 RepID=A0AAV4NS40_9ARAC|nr:hypothetical protein CDAR_212161 [Caerostris darwini]